MRQYAGFGSARESNRRYRYLLAQGQTGLSVAFDLPTQMGYDSDDPAARGEVGKVGVAIATIEDMRILTEGLPLDRVSISMTINSTASILLALLLAVARERGIAWRALSGTVQNDLLKEYVARGTYIFPPRPSLKITTDIFAFCAARGAALEHDLDLGVPHPRGGLDGRPGGRVHALERDRLRRGRPRPAASRSTTSRRGSRSSSTRTRTSSRRSPSSAPPVPSGPRSRATASARRIRAPGACGSTRRRPARP